MTDSICLEGIEVYARHGVLDHEQERAQVFTVDVTAFLDLAAAGGSDRIEDTVDYGSLASEVRDVVGAESNALIERVAERVASVVLRHERVERARVTVHKPNAPVEVVLGDVAVTVERGR